MVDGGVDKKWRQRVQTYKATVYTLLCADYGVEAFIAYGLHTQFRWLRDIFNC